MLIYLDDLKAVSNVKWSSIWEASKEPLRLLVLALIPCLLTYFADLPYEWAGFIVLVLRFVDKLLHEYGKENDNEKLTTGLTRF